VTDNRFFEARIREIATEVTSLQAPPDAWQRISARLADGEAVVLPLASRAPSKAPRIRVAGIVMLVIAAAAAAATIPGSPLRNWITRVRSVTPNVPEVEVPVAPSRAVEPIQSTTFIVMPVNGLVTVAFVNPAEGARVHIRFTEDGDVAVQAGGAASSAVFRSSEGRLTVAELEAGDLEIAIPGSLARIRVEVDGRVYLTKQNERIQVLAPTADTVGSEFVLPIGKD
jgi:hypothetical protein